MDNSKVDTVGNDGIAAELKINQSCEAKRRLFSQLHTPGRSHSHNCFKLHFEALAEYKLGLLLPPPAGFTPWHGICGQGVAALLDTR